MEHVNGSGISKLIIYMIIYDFRNRRMLAVDVGITSYAAKAH